MKLFPKFEKQNFFNFSKSEKSRTLNFLKIFGSICNRNFENLIIILVIFYTKLPEKRFYIPLKFHKFSSKIFLKITRHQILSKISPMFFRKLTKRLSNILIFLKPYASKFALKFSLIFLVLVREISEKL